MKRILAVSVVVILPLALPACQSSAPRPPALPGTPLQPEEPKGGEEALVVRKTAEEVVVAAWAEPRRLAVGGGQAQVLIRVQRRGGQPYSGVEVRLRSSAGDLYSGGKVLVTDARGMTRDRLTTRKSAEVTVNAGGTHYRFVVPVLPDSSE